VSPGTDATAAAILRRLLLCLPVAARGGEDGVEVAALARTLGADPRRVLRDLTELEGRAYYLRAGMGEQIQLSFTREHLVLRTTGEFQRPVRLSPREALALELALRVVARKALPEMAGGLHGLGARLVEELRSPVPTEGVDPAVALGEAEGGADPVRRRVEEALRRREELRILYCPPGREPTLRVVRPLLLAHAEGAWYLVARDVERGGLRAFRVDRMAEVSETGTSFRPDPEELAEAEGFLRDGRVHDGGGPQAPEPFTAWVEYSPAISRWIRERGWGEVEDLPDGGVRVRHAVVDPEWLVRHILGYGGDARLLEPDWVRSRIREAAARVAPGPGHQARSV